MIPVITEVIDYCLQNNFLPSRPVCLSGYKILFSNRGESFSTYKITANFGLKNAVITGIPASPESEQKIDHRMAENIYPWIDLISRRTPIRCPSATMPQFISLVFI